jgi:hypothetical protein
VIVLIGILALLAGSRALWPLRAQGRQEIKEAAKKALKAFLAQPTQPGVKGQRIGVLTDSRITESSGLAAGRRNRDVLWTHNDSGDGPFLFAVDRKGNTLARLTVTGAQSVDWEDIAIGPGADGKPALYIGDIGDNGHKRTDTVVYRIAEPPVDMTRTKQEATSSTAEKFPYRFPDGPHDCETLMVHPHTGDIYLVTKESSGNSGVYAFPKPLRPGVTAVLKKLASVTFASSLLSGQWADKERLTTGGDIAPDARHLVIRTYLMAYEWDIAPRQSLAEAFKGKPAQTMLPLTRQGEAICYRADGKAWLISSEGANAPLFEIPR